MTNPVHVGRTLESLRNSDFDTLSAIGEVLDNSIQANAKNIKMRITKNEVRKNKMDLTEIGFADDGDGMELKTIAKCLQLGFSERYNKRNGIGRFGVGMTLGAVTQCTRIEVYSKPRGGTWNFTYIDLDEMKDKEDAIIPDPKPVEIPRKYADMMEDYGTLVIWKNWDREDAKLEDMEIWIGRTYRKFIGSQIIDENNNVVNNPNQRHIFLDDNEISAFDPLYVTKTTYNDDVTQLEAPIKLEQTLHKFDQPPTKSSESSEITIRMSLLPDTWIQQGYRPGISTENKKRLVPGNEGISILRNDREVFYGHIPYYHIKDDTSSHYKGFIDLDRFWGCEISFNADMDHWFSIKNIKVGARPLPELRAKIEDLINPTIHEFRKEIRDLRDAKKNKERADTEGEISGTDNAEGVLGENSTESADPDDITEIIKESGKMKQETEWKLKEKLANNPIAFRKKTDMDERGSFIDVISRGGTSLIHLNMKHPFFQKFFDLRDEIVSDRKRSKEEREKLAQDIETNLQILFGSFVLAKKDLNIERNEVEKEVIDKLMRNWTYYLNKKVKTTLEDSG